MRVFTDAVGAVGGGVPATEAEVAQVRSNLTAIKGVVMMGSARGGVGKSALTANLAAVLAQAGRKVALLDADLNSPSLVAMLGMTAPRRLPIVEWVEPSGGPLGLRVVASNLLSDAQPAPISFLETEELPLATNGRGPTAVGYTRALRRLLGQTRYGALDVLLIDLSSGLESFARMAELVPQAALMLVSHPSDSCARVDKALIELAIGTGIPVLGIVENMAGFNCDGCHSVRPLMPQGAVAALAQATDVALIERLPFDPRFAETTDRGTLFVREYADTPLAKQIVAIAERIERTMAATATVSVPPA